jgi:UDP-N-acetylmuramate dehydrogenase
LLVRDGGFPGTVIILQGGLRRLEQTDEAHIFAEAGVSCGQLARLSARLGLRRLEFMAGIPGTVGGALAMNAGCHGNETWNQVHSVRVMTRDGRLMDREKSEYQVSYRHVEGPANEWFVGAYFFGTLGLKEEAMLEIHELLERRHQTQPTNQPSCGSVFRNPPGQYAAQLIESCALKGFSIGGAMVSPKHANFIVNTGTATAADIEQLIAYVKKTVLEKKSVSLIEEVQIIGIYKESLSQ